MKLVVSCNELRYGGQTYMKGEPFETVSERDAKVLKLIRKAEDAPALLPTPPVQPGPLQTVQPRALEVEPLASPSPQPAEVPVAAEVQPRRTYRRRDMKAEG